MLTECGSQGDDPTGEAGGVEPVAGERAVGEADAFEVETVGESIRQKVRDKHGVELKWEVRRMGHFLPGREVKEFMDGAPFTGAV